MKRFLVLLAIIVPMMAQAISLDECRRLARENYPLLKACGIIERSGQYTVEMAQTAWLPQLGLTAQATLQSDVAGYPDALKRMLQANGVNIKGMGKLQYKTALELGQTVYDGGTTKSRCRTFRLETQEESLATAVELYDLDSRVDEIFFSILLLGLQAEQIESSVSVIEANCNVVQAMLREGTASNGDADAMEAQLLTARQQLASVRTMREGYLQMLGIYIGRDNFSDPEMPLSEPTGQTDGRPELRLFDAKLQTIEARRGEIRASLMPRLSLFGTVYYGYPGLNYMEAMTDRAASWNFQAGVKLSWSIGNLYTRKPSLGRLQAMAEQISVQRETFLFNQRLEASSLQSQTNRWSEISRHDEEIVELRRRVRMAEEARLREGTINSVRLLQAIDNETSARLSALVHKIETMKTRCKLNHTLGK